MKAITKGYKSILLALKWLNEGSRVKFYYLAGINRPIIPSHVTRLAESVRKLGVLRPVIVAELDFITGRKELFIVDGQHLFNALLRLGWEIPYITIKVKDQQDLVEKIALLNSSSKTWGLIDYTMAWASLKEDYKKLNHYFNVYDFELSIIAGVFAGTGLHSSQSATRLIKSGEFQIRNEQRGVEILDYMTDVFKVIPRMSRYEIRYFCAEYLKFVSTRGDKYREEHAQFVEWLNEHKKCLKFGTMGEDVLVKFFQEFIKNKRKRGRPRKK